MSQAIITDVDSITSDSEAGEIGGDTSSDDNIIITHQRKKKRIKSDSSISPSEAEETLTFNNIRNQSLYCCLARNEDYEQANNR
jgi:hypothetical protein